jgi:hypothetical protein
MEDSLLVNSPQTLAMVVADDQVAVRTTDDAHGPALLL